MAKFKVAIPSMGEGISAEISAHFGHANGFVIVQYDSETKTIENVDSIINPPHEAGACARPIMLLKGKGIDSAIVGGIGQRPLMAFVENGMKVYRGINGSIEDNVKALMKNELAVLMESSCSHH
jgi:predicted Fe-Mo cluster-binding NifX family protein